MGGEIESELYLSLTEANSLGGFKSPVSRRGDLALFLSRSSVFFSRFISNLPSRQPETWVAGFSLSSCLILFVIASRGQREGHPAAGCGSVKLFARVP